MLVDDVPFVCMANKIYLRAEVACECNVFAEVACLESSRACWLKLGDGRAILSCSVGKLRYMKYKGSISPVLAIRIRLQRLIRCFTDADTRSNLTLQFGTVPRILPALPFRNHPAFGT
jgi:hypothetical protein